MLLLDICTKVAKSFHTEKVLSCAYCCQSPFPRPPSHKHVAGNYLPKQADRVCAKEAVKIAKYVGFIRYILLADVWGLLCQDSGITVSLINYCSNTSASRSEV